MKRKKSVQPTTLQIGDVVKVSKGFIDPDTGVDMSGWHGRIVKFYSEYGTALIAFDSLTIQNIPQSYVDGCEAEGLSWNEYGYDLTDLIKVEPRDTESDVASAADAVEERYPYNFLYLGEEGKEINRILFSVDPDGDLGPLEAWHAYLEKELTFPFHAIIDEVLGRSPLRVGDKVKVHAFAIVDEHYGLIVTLRHGRRKFDMPLCELRAADEKSANYDLIQLYRFWFANRS